MSAARRQTGWTVDHGRTWLWQHTHHGERRLHHLLRAQGHLRQLARQEEVRHLDSGPAVGSSAEELLEAQPLPIVLDAQLCLADHLLLTVPIDRGLGVQTTPTTNLSGGRGWP